VILASDNRVAVDTCVLIDILIGKSNVARAMESVMKLAKMGACELIISEVTVAEVTKLAGDCDVPSTIEEFLANRYCRRYPLSASVSAKASELIRKYELETCDAMIAATAIVHNSGKLFTHDGDMRKSIRSSQKLPSTVPTEISGMSIRSPLYDEELCKSAGLEFGLGYIEDMEAHESQSKQEKDQDKTEARP
jgi:predicted nucleic acid-binding protein